VQQASCNGVLDSQHADTGRILLHLCKDFLKGVATDQLYLLALKIEVGSYVVKRSYQSLYRYSFHSCILFFIRLFKKTPLSLGVCEAEPYFIFAFTLIYILHTAYRFTVYCKVKVIAVKVSVLYHNIHRLLPNRPWTFGLSVAKV
jgi:hypothetical protein